MGAGRGNSENDGCVIAGQDAGEGGARAAPPPLSPAASQQRDTSQVSTWCWGRQTLEMGPGDGPAFWSGLLDFVEESLGLKLTYNQAEAG